MKFYLPLAATVGALALLTACADDQASCLQITRQEAIKLAIAAKPEPDRIRKQDQPMWTSDKVEGVELPNVPDPTAVVAVVTFRGDGARAPKAFVYGDCVVEWSHNEVTR
jgi:hypothetical protein